MKHTLVVYVYVIVPPRAQRMPGCQSSNHAVCYGELWRCEGCGKSVCHAEGGDDNPELCDTCWVEQVEGSDETEGRQA